MTVPPPPDPGFPPPWNRPSAGTAWSTDEPPAGLPPQGYPTQGYPTQGHPTPGHPTPGYPTPGYPSPYDPQQGNPQQGNPAAGYPPPYPAPGYPGQPPAKPGTNGMAIAALIFGIIGGVLFGFIFGLIALSQIKKSGQGGRGLAVAGLVLSGIWTLLIAVLVIAAIASTPSRDDSGQITSSGSVSATALKPGDCVNNLQDSTALLSLPAVPCSQAHEGEVFAVFDLPAGPYPGSAAVDKQVTAECTARLAAYSPSAGSGGGYGLFSVYPQEQNWKANDREVACLAQALSGPSTGSIKGR